LNTAVQTAPRRRDWRLAAALSIVPGLGQIYNVQPRKAAFFLLATVFTLGPSILLITFGERLGRSLLQARAFAAFLLLSMGSVLVFLVLFVLGLFLWASAAVDAGRSARELSNGRPASGRWWFVQL
jgi:hypothetical protein